MRGMRLKTDEELARELSTGEVEAFDELYRRYSGRLATYTGRLLRDRGAGEDVAQSSLMSAYETLSRGTRPRHVRAWLFRIARNNALEQLAGRKPLGDPATEQVVEGGHAESSARTELLAAIQALPERQRRVFLLREIQGLRIDEIAGELALTVAQVEQSLFAARNRLAEHLVFGERLACATLGNVDVVKLGSVGRRAVKAHLRSCPSCRSARPAMAKVSMGIVPVQLLALLRGAVAPIFGGGSSIAMPAAALTAAGALAVATPVAVPKLAQKLLNRPAAAPAAAPAVDAGAPSPPHRRRSAAPTPLVRRAPADRPAVRTQRQALPPAAPPGGSVSAPPSVPTPEPVAPTPSEPTPAPEPQAPKPPAADPSPAEPSPSAPAPVEDPTARAPEPPAAGPPAHGQPPVATTPPVHEPVEDSPGSNVHEFPESAAHEQPAEGRQTGESDPVEPVPPVDSSPHDAPPAEEQTPPEQPPPTHGTTP